MLNFFVIFLSFSIVYMSLSAEMYAQKNKQELELLGYNIGFGILTTTAGAIINKPKGQSLVDCIKKSWWPGALGGTLQYTGKKMTYLITKNENYLWGWPSKLVHSAGTSICHNAAEGRPFGE
ncbi:MAG: hypothetical protein LBC48_05045, partial [Dysgonamonadaceae bacterium]|nr:hypothetical protein [Dysgonamonadaceae bacterium]